MEEQNEEIQKYLKKFNCRGCYSRCLLDNPNCGRSRIFIKEAMEKYEQKNK